MIYLLPFAWTSLVFLAASSYTQRVKMKEMKIDGTQLSQSVVYAPLYPTAVSIRSNNETEE